MTPDFLPDHETVDARSRYVGQEPSFPASQTSIDAHGSHAGGEQVPKDFLSDQLPPGAQIESVGQEQISPLAIVATMPMTESLAGNQNPADQAMYATTPRQAALDLLDPTLALAADVVGDIEKVRIANQNRLRTLTTSFEDGGFGLTESHADVARLAAMVKTMEQLEHDAVLQLQRTMRRHPLGAWVKASKGVGEKQAARLLAAIGDPYINSATGQPRTVSQLWAFSGLAPNQKRVKGQKSNWSGNAKMRAHLIAASCIKKLDSPFRAAYDNRRTHTAVTQPDWTLGHSHNDALRIVSKEILKSLWIAARDLHQGAQK